MLRPLERSAKVRSAFPFHPRDAQGRPLFGLSSILKKPSGTQDTPRNITPRHAIRHPANPRMAVAAAQWEYGNDDFEIVLSRLARTCDEIRELRKRGLELESSLQDAIDGENFTAAARLRDEAREVRSKNPEALISSLSKQMQAAVNGERYAEAAKYRDQLRNITRSLPEYQLAGLWEVREGLLLSEFVGSENAELTVWNSHRIDYNADTLTATGTDGKIIFSVDVSKPVNESVGPEIDYLDEGEQKGVFRTFGGEGNLFGERSIPGEMYLLDDKTIGYWWSGLLLGPGERIVAPSAAEWGLAATISGEGLKGEVQGGGGVFMILDKVDEDDKGAKQHRDDPGKLFKLDVKTGD